MLLFHKRHEIQLSNSISEVIFYPDTGAMKLLHLTVRIFLLLVVVAVGFGDRISSTACRHLAEDNVKLLTLLRNTGTTGMPAPHPTTQFKHASIANL